MQFNIVKRCHLQLKRSLCEAYLNSQNVRLKLKCNVPPHAVKAYRGSGGVALLITNIDARWKWSGFRPGHFRAGKVARYSKIICACALFIAFTGVLISP